MSTRANDRGISRCERRFNVSESRSRTLTATSINVGDFPRGSRVELINCGAGRRAIRINQHRERERDRSRERERGGGGETRGALLREIYARPRRASRRVTPIGHAVAPRRLVIRGIMHILMITKRNTDTGMDTCKYADEWRPDTTGARVHRSPTGRRPTLPQSAPHKLQSRHVLSRRPARRIAVHTLWK